MEDYPDSHKAVYNLLQNKLHLGRFLGIPEPEYTPPSPHYPHKYSWDICFNAIMYALDGEPESLRHAMMEQLSLYEGQLENGMIPNMQFAKKGEKKKGRRGDPEIIFVLGSSADGSNYIQPPVQALSTRTVYEALRKDDPIKAAKFLREAYEPTAKSLYFIGNTYSNTFENKIIGVSHGHATGMDSSPIFDDTKPLRLKRNGVETRRIKDLINVPIDYFSVIWHGRKLKKAGGDNLKEREIYWMNDIMMNCVYVDNLYEMAKLAECANESNDEAHFKSLAQEVEQQILTKMWFPHAREGKGAFYALDKDGQPIDDNDKITISNLFPLTLNVSPVQLESILDLMDEGFDTDYPLPSVATFSKNYDPHNQEKDRLWRGPKWMNVDWYLVERGLQKQIWRSEISKDLKDRCYKWAKKISNASKEIIETHGPWEHYDPETSEPQRKRVKNFAWSNLAYFMPNLDILRIHVDEDDVLEDAA